MAKVTTSLVMMMKVEASVDSMVLPSIRPFTMRDELNSSCKGGQQHGESLLKTYFLVVHEERYCVYFRVLLKSGIQ